MASYPTLVQIAWDTVEQLVGDWIANPHFWEKEIDIQAELCTRLSLVYRTLGRSEVTEIRDGKRFRYSRVCCEPQIPCVDSRGAQYRAVPDVVVWDELEGEQNDQDYWPILWACEIKYLTGNTGDLDKAKLGALIDQKRIAYGCWLSFKVNSRTTSPTFSWDKATHARRLWTCQAHANPRTGTEDLSHPTSSNTDVRRSRAYR
jgi:hypothetical protein